MISSSSPSSITAAWFRAPVKKPQAKQRLFIFHHAGGSANSYFRWAEAAPQETEVLLCELPGRGVRMREPTMTAFSEMISSLLPHLEREMDRPSILFGHSLGALTAFEAYKRISPNVRAMVKGLGLSSFLPPTHANVGARVRISHLPDTEFMAYMERFAPVSDIIKANPKTLAFFLPVMRADIQLLENYIFVDAPPTDARLVVFAGDSDPTNSISGMKDWNLMGQMIGDVHVMKGNHFHVFNHVESILKTLHLQFP